MTRCVQILFAVVLSALAVRLSASAPGPNEKDDAAAKAAAAQGDLLRLTDSLDRDEDEIEKQARALAANHSLAAVMAALKPREQGGVGVGPTPGALLPDGIDLKLLAMRKPLTRKELETQRDDLMRMAQVLLTVSRAAPFYASQYAGPEPFRTRKDWIQESDHMASAAQDLIDALNGDDLKAVTAAAGKVNARCNDCHGRYRDS